MDATETLVRERFEGALADVQLNVASLVGAGTAQGQRLRRRRRFQVATAAVASVAVIAAAGLVGVKGGLFDNATPPAHQDHDGQLVPSNPRALAAAVIADLPSTVKVTKVQGGSGPYSLFSESLSTVISGQPIPIALLVTRRGALPLHCQGRRHETPDLVETCRMITLADGAKARFDSTDLNPGRARQIQSLVVFVHRASANIELDFNQHPLSFQVFPGEAATFRAIALSIVNDPAVGPRTYQRFIDAQGSVPNYSTFPAEPDPSAPHPTSG